MPIYITQGRYSQSAIKGMVAKPEDRTNAVRKVCEAAGGKLLSYYIVLGEIDFLIVTDMPDNGAVSAVALAAGASGGVASTTTMAAMTTAEAQAAFAKAGSITGAYKAPGG